MRFAGLFGIGLTVAASGCATRPAPPPSTPARVEASEVSGIWDGMNQTTISVGLGAGDTRIEKQEWHLTQAGSAIRGYYIAALTFVSGDGRPYVCNRQPQFSAMQRFDVSGHVRGGVIEIEELEQQSAQHGNRCDPGLRQLARYRGRLDGDVLTLTSGGQRQTLYRIHEPGAGESLVTEAAVSEPPDDARGESPLPDHAGPSPILASTAPPADVSGMWVWEHNGVVPGGDEKQEREEWHVTQDGAKLTGYYDRVVHQVSTDGQAYRCSMALDFQIVTRYQFRGEVAGNRVLIYESSFEVLNPTPCDNGKRRLDAYEGQASTDELRLVWGVGGQVLRRPRPDVPTQRF
ncbi:MAG TPA: hypothetical protein VMT03_08560 [Polyangia bacterium]|nr:hypothetical protein [Polyangia bacterium]